jgi:hypothetical protein
LKENDWEIEKLTEKIKKRQKLKETLSEDKKVFESELKALK